MRCSPQLCRGIRGSSTCGGCGGRSGCLYTSVLSSAGACTPAVRWGGEWARWFPCDSAGSHRRRRKESARRARAENRPSPAAPAGRAVPGVSRECSALDPQDWTKPARPVRNQATPRHRARTGRRVEPQGSRPATRAEYVGDFPGQRGGSGSVSPREPPPRSDRDPGAAPAGAQNHERLPLPRRPPAPSTDDIPGNAARSEPATYSGRRNPARGKTRNVARAGDRAAL
jgi:hypothetical protein